MPVFGEQIERLALALDATIKGPDNPLADPNEKNHIEVYYAPAGYIITDVRKHIKNDQGSAWNSYNWSPDPPDFTLKYEQFIEELRRKTGYLFDEVISYERIQSEYEILTKAYDSPKNWGRAFTGHAKAIAGPGERSEIQIDYYAQLMYVGNESDVSHLLDEWLTGVSVEKKFSYNDVKDSLKFLNTANYNIEGNLLVLNNKGSNSDGGSVYFDTGHLPNGCEASFNAHISTIGLPKSCEAVIWELPATIQSSSGRAQVNEWQDLSTNYTTNNNENVLRFEIYSHDNVEGDTVIQLDSTVATLLKTF